jgi:hypothetical protein
MNPATPPRWAEVVLRAVLSPDHRDTVSGDLLEEYRDRIHPARSAVTAALWYVRQVAGFAWRANRTWAALLSAAFVLRTALDWFLPPSDFHLRSTVLTIVTACTFLGAGFWAAWRSRTITSGAVAAAIVVGATAVGSAIADAVLLTIWHDPATLAAIDASGGLREGLVLPVILVLPGVLLGTLGGLLGRSARLMVGPAE